MRKVICLTLLFASLGRAQLTGRAAGDAVSRLNKSRQHSRIGNSVDTASGAFILEKTAMSVQGGRSVDFNLTYNSLLTQTRGALGFGWSHPYEAFITGDPQGTVTVHWDINRKNSFRFTGAGSTYEPLDEAVRYDKLERDSDGAWELTRPDGTVYEFYASGQVLRIGNKVRQFVQTSRQAGESGLGPPQSLTETIGPSGMSLVYRSDGLLEQILTGGEELLMAFFQYDSGGRLAELWGPVTLGPETGGDASGDIPDNDPAGLTHFITVTRTEPIGLVFVGGVSIQHSMPSDLRITLISPQGTRFTFPTASDSSEFLNLSQTVQAVFNGENPAGTWRVVIIDQQPGATGRLIGWKLRFSERTNPTRFTYDANSGITLATAPDGERLFANSYDFQGRVVAQDDGLDTNQIATFSYQETGSGVQTTYTDRLGNSQVFEHDGQYRLLSQTDPLGNTSSFAYNSFGDRVQITDALQHSTRFDYDANGNVSRVVDPAGNATTMTYDDRNNLTRFRDALGQESRFQYNDNNNLTQITDAAGHRDTKSYNSNSQLTGNLLDDGAGINYAYENGMLASGSHPAQSQGLATTEYDDFGRMTQIVDPDGFAHQTAFNSNGDAISRTDPLGNTGFSRYDRRNRLLEKEDRNGNVTRFQYDNNDNLIARMDALGHTARFEYDGEDRLIRTVDPRLNASTTTYDAAGRVIAETDALGNTVRHEYDAVGNEVAVYDANGVATTRTTYGPTGLPVLKVDALGHAFSTEFDAVGQPVEIRDPLDRAFQRSYDELGRLIEVRDPLNRASKQQYLADDVLEKIIDPGGREVGFVYNEANFIELVRVTGNTTRLEYNGRDLVTTETRPSGGQFDFAYDEAGRLAARRFSTAGIIRQSLFYSYDDNGNLTEVSTVNTATTPPRSEVRLARAYDALDRVIRFTDARGNTLGYSYDSAGNLAVLTYPDGKTVSYTYDEANRMTQVRDWAGRVTRYSYDTNSRLTGIEFPNGTSRVMEYDAAGRILRRQERSPQGAPIADYGYSYDPVGQITVESSGITRPPFLPQPVTMSYGSDNSLVTFNGQPVSFDNDGNMTRGPLGDSFRDFVYDPSNNLSRAGDVSYTYDEEDRLTGFVTPDGLTSLLVSPGPGPSQVLAKTDPNGAVTRYVYGVGLVYEETAGRTRTYHYDHRGSTVAFTGDEGAVSGTVSFGPFGELGQRTGQNDSLFLFGGLFGIVTDPNGLNYMRFRWYSPQIKRFVNQDAHYGDIATTGSLNRFAYAGNNPVIFNDPSGEFFFICGAAAATVAVVVQVTADVITGQETSIGDLVAAAVAGFGAGLFIGTCPACSVAGAIGIGVGTGALSGAAGNALKQLIDSGTVDPTELIGAGLLGGIVGGLTGGVVGASGLKPVGEVAAGGGIGLVGGIGLGGGFGLGGALGGGALSALIGVVSGHSPATASRGGSVQPPASRPTRTSQQVNASGRRELNQGQKAAFGEYAHWQFYLDSLQQAGVPAPNNPHNMLTTF